MSDVKDFIDNGVIDVIGLHEWARQQPKQEVTCDFCARVYEPDPRGYVPWFSPFCSRECYDATIARMTKRWTPTGWSRAVRETLLPDRVPIRKEE